MNSPRFDNAVVFVTGANGGLGREFVSQFVASGARRVYAASRQPAVWDSDRVVSIPLDVTDRDSVTRAAAAASDTTIVINNAAISRSAPILTGDEGTIRSIFETNFFGALAVARAFVPVLAHNTHGVLLNVESVLAWVNMNGAYSAAKAALKSATDAMRLELAYADVHVAGLVLGPTRTPLTEGLDVALGEPEDVVREALEGIDRRDYEIVADEYSHRVKARLSGPVEDLYPSLRS